MPSLCADASPCRSTSSLAVADMSTRDSPEALIRIGCGAFIGLMVGFIIVAATLSFYAASIEMLLVVGVSVVVCAFLAWRLGDQVYRFLMKWLRRF